MSLVCHPEGVVGIGPTPCEIMVVGIAPGKNEWITTKKPFTGPSGKLLDGLLKFVGLAREDIYATNLLCWWKDAPTKEEIELCMPRFVAELKAVQPKVVLCLGKIVTETLMGRPFGKVRGGAFWSDEFNCWFLSTYHPAAYLRSGDETTFASAEINDGVRDFRKIAIYLKAPRDFGKVVYRIAENLEEINTFFTHLVAHAAEDVVALDIETYYTRGTGMKSMAFACECGTFHIPEALIYGPDYNILLDVVARWTFHNGQFDTQKIKTFYGITLPIREDTLLQSYSLDERGGGDTETDGGGAERAVGIHGLKRLAMEYCGGELYSEDARQDVSTEDGSKPHVDDLPPDKLALYNSSDADYTYRLQRYFEPLQEADEVRQMYLDILIPATNILRDINERGVYVDEKVIQELALEWGPQWLEAEDELLESAKAQGWTGGQLELDINTRSHKQLSTFIYDILGAPTVGTGKMVRSTAKPIIDEMVEKYPDHPASIWLQKLLNWRGLNKDITTWIRKLEETKDANGFVHPEALLHGTRNGRTAYHNPPVQTVQKARTVGESRARIRKVFSASPPSAAGTGPRLLMEADLRQAELWVSYFVSGDEVMYQDLQSGDFHARVAEANWGKTKETCTPVEWEYMRDSAKRVVYGINYGAGPNVLTKGAKLTGVGGSNYMFLATKQQAQKAIDAYLKRYHKFNAWRENERKIVTEEGEQVSRTGRKRRYFMIQSYNQLNQAINTPVSSFSHDFILMDIMELHPLLKEWDAYIYFEVHDSIVIDLPQKYLTEVSSLVEHIMTKPRWGTPCGVPVDLKVGPNWYDMESIEKYEEKLVV